MKKRASSFFCQKSDEVGDIFGALKFNKAVFISSVEHFADFFAAGIHYLKRGESGKNRDDRRKIFKRLVCGNSEENSKEKNEEIAPEIILVFKILGNVSCSVKTFSAALQATVPSSRES